MKPEYPERIRVWQNEPNKEFVASFPGDLYVEENSEYIRRDLHEAALLDAHQRGRREGMEEAAEVVHQQVPTIPVEGPTDPIQEAEYFALGHALIAIRAKAQEGKT